MSQIAIGYGPSEAERFAWAGVLEVLREIVQTAGLKQIAYDLDVSPSLLGDALAERDRKGVRAEWLPTILLRASELQRTALLCALANPVGFDIVPRRVLTPEEELRALKAHIRDRFGKAGSDAIKEVTR